MTENETNKYGLNPLEMRLFQQKTREHQSITSVIQKCKRIIHHIILHAGDDHELSIEDIIPARDAGYEIDGLYFKTNKGIDGDFIVVDFASFDAAEDGRTTTVQALYALDVATGDISEAEISVTFPDLYYEYVVSAVQHGMQEIPFHQFYHMMESARHAMYSIIIEFFVCNKYHQANSREILYKLDRTNIDVSGNKIVDAIDMEIQSMGEACFEIDERSCAPPILNTYMHGIEMIDLIYYDEEYQSNVMLRIQPMRSQGCSFLPEKNKDIDLLRVSQTYRQRELPNNEDIELK